MSWTSRRNRRALKTLGPSAFGEVALHLDVILASLPFEETADPRARSQKVFGRTLKVPTPEDLIIFKSHSGGAKDLLEAVGIARRHSKSLDRQAPRDGVAAAL